MGATGSHSSAMLLVRLMFWQDVMKGKEFAKKSIELQDELYLSKDVIRRDLIKLQQLGLIKYRVKRFNGTPNYHIQLNIEHCNKALVKCQNTTFADYNNRKLPLLESSILPLSIESSKIPQSLTEEDNKKTKEEDYSTEINSVMPHSDFLKKEMEERTEKNKGAAPKSKPLKELSPLDKLIAEKVKDIAERFKVWYLSHKKIAYPYKRHDFVNLTGMFKDLCNNNGYTPDKVVEDITKIVTNYKKLSTFNQNNFSLNLIATKYNVLLSEIDTYKEPVTKPNPNEPVPYVKPPPRQDTHNGNWLPLGMSRQQYIDLCIEVGREQILNGNEPEDYNPYEVTHSLHKSLINLTPDQVKTILNRYDVQ
jgi:hypothetical protein